MIELLKKLFGKSIQESKNKIINQNINHYHNMPKPPVPNLTGPDAIEKHLKALVNLQIYTLHLQNYEDLLKNDYNYNIEDETFNEKTKIYYNLLLKLAYPESPKNNKE